MAEGNKIVLHSVFCGKCNHLMPLTENDFYQCQNPECENCLRQWKIVKIIMEVVVNAPESVIPGVSVG